jgi:beta-galactosidase
MKSKIFLSILLICGLITQGQTQRSTLFDEEWKFYRGGVERGEHPDFDDSKWRVVDLPHDWSI